MDERIHRHAETIVDWSARIDAGDDVVVSVGEGAHDLAVAVAAELGDRGANPVFLYSSGEISTAYLDAHDGAFEGPPPHELALFEEADSALILGGTRNTSEGAGVPSDVRQARGTAHKPVFEARMDTDWVSTVHPTRAMAQQAGMGIADYRDFVYEAILRDWESLAEEMAGLKDILDEGSEVRIVKEEGGDGVAGDTDLSMSIEHRNAVNSAASVAYGSHNLPSGEVFTAPVVESVSGEVVFDVPVTISGTEVRDVRLAFEEGQVVDWSAGRGASTIGDVLDTDEGARRLGELGIGMNRGIDRPTGSTLFDEKMAGTVHLALGRAYEACLPEGQSGNDSAVHADLITDMATEGTRLEVDGEVIQRDGVFRWEEGFE